MMRGAAADTSLGGLIVSDSFWILAVLTALLSAFTVVRHTRQDGTAAVNCSVLRPSVLMRVLLLRSSSA